MTLKSIQHTQYTEIIHLSVSFHFKFENIISAAPNQDCSAYTFRNYKPVLRVMALFQVWRVRDKIWRQKTVMAVQLFVKFILFIHSKSANLFTLIEGRQARRPLKILIWTVTAGSSVESNNYPNINIDSSYDSVTFATVGKEAGGPPARLKWHWQTTLVSAEAVLQPGQGICFCTLITWSISSSTVDFFSQELRFASW